MWSKKERKLFRQATFHISSANYKRGLRLADRLLALIADDPLKTAYVLGCKKAVALRHLGHTKEAENAFRQALIRAKIAASNVIAAYIYNDWSSMRESVEAMDMINKAIALCEQAANTPDPERALTPDIAYFQATLARLYAHNGQLDLAAPMLAESKRTLKRYAYGSHPVYKHAYLVVLMWEREILLTESPAPPTLLQRWAINKPIALEVIRQHKMRAAAALLLWPWRKKRLYPNRPS